MTPHRRPEPDVSILIVNWNAGDLLGDCLASLPSALGGRSFEAIVVDNASSDHSLAGLPGGAWQRVVRRPDNAGFAVATNQAAAAAAGRYLLLLNPDTACHPESIATLVAWLEAHPDAAAAGPRLVGADGRPQRSCWRGYPGAASAWIDALYAWKLPWLPLVRRSEVALEPGSAAVDVDHLLGACMLISRAAWDAVGPLDEGYFLFFEETDWCRRARRAGYRVAAVPAATVTHHGEHSVYQVPAASTRHYYRSFFRFLRRGGGSRTTIAWAKAGVMAAAAVRLGLWSWRWLGRRRGLAVGMLRGYGRVLLEVPGY